MMTENKNYLHVSEQFYSIQGEGKTMGVPSYFIRLAGCNLMCGGAGTEKTGELYDGATWRCDSIEVWLKGTKKSFDKIVKDFGDDFIHNITHGAHVIFTGGEPFLHIRAINDFIGYLYETIKTTDVVNTFFEIETNGTINVHPAHLSEFDLINVSPKLKNSGMPYDKRINYAALGTIQKAASNEFYNDNSDYIFKFVVSDYKDMDEINQIINDLKIPNNKVYLMPAADDRDKMIIKSEFIVEICKHFNYNYSSRLQVNIWDKTTGV